jgi:hypothetical protein
MSGLEGFELIYSGRGSCSRWCSSCLSSSPCCGSYDLKASDLRESRCMTHQIHDEHTNEEDG